MYYLLGTQVIVDISRGGDSPASRWLRSVDGVIRPRDIKVSSMSRAAIEIEFANLTRANGRLPSGPMLLKPRIDGVFEQYQNRGSILPVSAAAVMIWAKYLQEEIKYTNPDGEMLSVGLEEKFILASALAGFEDVPITLVARREQAHTKFAPLGLTIVDPYNGIQT